MNYFPYLSESVVCGAFALTGHIGIYFVITCLGLIAYALVKRGRDAGKQ